MTEPQIDTNTTIDLIVREPDCASALKLRNYPRGKSSPWEASDMNGAPHGWAEWSERINRSERAPFAKSLRRAASG